MRRLFRHLPLLVIINYIRALVWRICQMLLRPDHCCLSWATKSPEQMATYHYLLNHASLQITCSDSQQDHVDEERIPEVHDHPDGYKRYYVQQFSNTPLSKEWRKKLGRDLATLFLLQPNNGTSLSFSLLSFYWQRQWTTFWPSSPKAINFSVIRRESTMILIALMHIFTVLLPFFPLTFNANNIFQ